MSVFLLSNKDTTILINLHEFVYTPEVFEAIFFKNDSCNVQEMKENKEDLPTSIDENEKKSTRAYLGQPSVFSKFPEIVNEVAEFFKLHGFSVQSRRRDEAAYSFGVTIAQIQKHIYSKFPLLKEHNMLLATVRRMFEVPDKRNIASNRYKGFVNAKVSRKQNSYREPHQDAHYVFGRKKLRHAFASLHSKDILMVSADDMAKIKVGARAVSRYHQIRRVFMKNDAPNLSDHDFPYKRYLLNVSGYMALQSKEITPEVDGLTNASIYDMENQRIDESSIDFQLMKAEGKKSSIFEVLSRQAELHLNVAMSKGECKEMIYEKLDGLIQINLNLVSMVLFCFFINGQHRQVQPMYRNTRKNTLGTRLR